MAGVQINTRCGVRLRAAILIVATALGGWSAWGQKPDQPAQLPIETLLSQELPQVPPQSPREMVVELRIVGNRNVPVEKVITFIRTRAGRPYDPEMIEEDVRRLMSDRGHHFVSVRPLTQKVPGGRIVTFELVERPVMGYIKYVGNQAVKKKVLAGETGLKANDAMDPFAVEEGRRRMEEYYHSKGFSKVQIQIFEGSKPSDRGAIYIINEGPKQRYLWTSFEGNTIANDGRLRTQIQAKPGFLWFFRGEVDRKQIDEDLQRLTAYYRGLGFFRARVGRKLDYNDAMNWLSLTFVIDEGPRYKVRNIVLMGNKRFSAGRLQRDAKLRAGEYFDQSEMTADTTTMTDLYGGIGYVFANVKPDTRFLDVPGQVDLVYNVKEGRRYRVGKINVDIKGEYPHTRLHTVLNRMSIHPGDIVDTRELRNSERRLKASGLFASGQGGGGGPKIVFTPPDLEKDPETGETPQVADRPGGSGGGRGGRFRGQSPDVQPYRAMRPTGEPDDDEEELVDLVVLGELLPGKDGGVDEPLRDPRMVQVVGKRTGQPRQPLEYVAPASPEAAPVLPMLPGHVLPGEVPVEQLPREIVTPDDTGVESSLPPGTIVRGQQPDTGNSQLDTSGWQSDRTNVAPSANPSYGAAGPSSLRWGNQNNSQNTNNAAPNYGATGINRNGVPATSASLQGATAAQPNAEVYGGGNGFSVPSFDSNSRNGSDRLRTMDPGVDPRAPVGGPPTGIASMPAAGNSPYPASSYPAGAVQTSNGIVTGTTAANTSPMTGEYRPVTQGTGPAPIVGSNVAFEQGRSVDRSVDRWMYRDPPDLMGRAPNQDPPLYLPLNPNLEETQTGRLMFSIGVNSDSGLVGSVVVDEQNFDWTRWPHSWEEIRNGTAWRGAGQRFRVEAAPGTSVSRYTMSFTEPYLLDTSIMLGLSGYYYQRIYSDQWTEERGGGRVTMGYQFLPDISGSISYRGENVVISDPASGNSGVVPPDVAAVLGSNTLHGFGARLTWDKRDNQFLATEGYYVDVGFEQVAGSYNYSRADIDFRKYFWTYERPDHSGRHVISLAGKFAVTSDNTPVYDRYYAGGYSSLRGYSFRGVSPRYDGIATGGDAMLLASAEYMFPITADDMLRGVVFVDTGTVEPALSHWNQKYRVAPGFGMRITIPAMGPAPIALDFAFPVAQQDGDDKQVFSFFIGFLR